jgi:hypothetical protein
MDKEFLSIKHLFLRGLGGIRTGGSHRLQGKETKKGKEHEFSEKRSCKPGQPSSHIAPIFASSYWLAF